MDDQSNSPDENVDADNHVDDGNDSDQLNGRRYYSRDMSKEQQKLEIAKLELERSQFEFNKSIQNQKWMTSYWRPLMSYVYMLICIFDFIVAPCLVMFLFRDTFHSWEPLTLKGSGLIHLAFGAILGITSWNRSFDKERERYRH